MQQIFEKTANDYKRDLDAIAGLARRHQTHVFVSSVIVNEAWKPLASVHGPGIDAASRRLFDDNVDAGAEVYERGGFDAALPYFRTAYRVDPDSAIANYYLGMTYVRLRQHDEGRKYLARAIELDAKPYYRPSALLWKAAAAVERESGGEYYHYVDAVSAYHDALAHGFTDADFIADLQHPNVTGHMFLARQFLCAMKRAGLVGPAARGVDDCVPVWEFDFRRAVAEYQERVDGIAMMKYYIPHAVSRWFIGKADVSTYPNDFLVAAEREIEEFYAQSERKPEDRVLYLVFKAYIELKRKPLSSSGKTRAIELLNQAQAVDASFLHGHSWASEFDNIGSLGDVLARNGIAFQPDRGIFADAST